MSKDDLANGALLNKALAAKEIRVKLARENFASFVRYVLKDEETGNGVDLSPTHEKWVPLLEAHNRLILWSHVEAAKSSFITVARTLYDIGKNPNIRVAIISNTADQASKFLGSVAKYIAESPEYNDVFPDVKKSEPWTTTKIQVVRSSVLKDPTVQAFGVHGAITGARIDRLILDDILDYENCRTAGGRREVINWYNSALAGRLTKNSKVYMVGTAFHPDDIMHVFSRNTEAWHSERFPVIDSEGVLAWPDRWPVDRIEQRKKELGPLEFNRQMLCSATKEEDSRCKREWIEKCLARGDGWTQISALPLAY